MRLHLEGPEPVSCVDLSAHFHARFRNFWLRDCPVVSQDKYDSDEAAWEVQRKKTGLKGGDGIPPGGFSGLTVTRPQLANRPAIITED